MNLDEEERRATEMLVGRTVRLVRRHHAKEVMVEFTDGTRLFVDAQIDRVALSITGDVANE